MTIALENLDKAVRDHVLKALQEPVLVTDGGKPILVVRNLLEDDVADDLIARHPTFKGSIRRARQQKAEGKVTTLDELWAKYSSK